jgi:hypothetical protein
VVDHGWVTQSNVDQQRRGQEGAKAWELTGWGVKWRVEHGGLVLGLTGARAAVWWPGW